MRPAREALGGQLGQAVERAQQRRLATARGPDQGEHLALVDRQRHRLDRGHPVVVDADLTQAQPLGPGRGRQRLAKRGALAHGWSDRDGLAVEHDRAHRRHLLLKQERMRVRRRGVSGIVFFWVASAQLQGTPNGLARGIQPRIYAHILHRTHEVTDVLRRCGKNRRNRAVAHTAPPATDSPVDCAWERPIRPTSRFRASTNISSTNAAA